jgi:hypothetical protein
MILSVLSGERLVTEVIEELELSRQMYYLLETKALNAMLPALVPGSERASADPSATSPAKRIAELEEKVKRLEQSKRRGEHMLSLTRQVLGPGPVKLGRGGRPSKKAKKTMATSSKTAEHARSERSKSMTKRRMTTKRTTSTTEPTKSSSMSSPMLDGADAR